MKMDFVTILSIIGSLASIYRLYLTLKRAPDVDQFDIRFKSIRNLQRQVNHNKLQKQFLAMLMNLSNALGENQQKKKSGKKKK